MIVIKFGGTSVADSISMKQAGKIVNNQVESNLIVILSACSGITNKLIKAVEISAQSGFESAENLFESIQFHHLNLINELIENEIQTQFAIDKTNQLLNRLKELLIGIGLLNENNPQMYDEAVSFGEFLSSNIFNCYLNSIGISSKIIDAVSVIKTDSNFNSANVDFVQTNILLNDKIVPCFGEHQVVVSQGFIGSNTANKTTTLGRGGSDYSAAVFASGLNADEIQIWTDVSGVMTTDPRLFMNAKTIPLMTANEIGSLSFFGAKVLHPLAIVPAMNKNIPVKVLNTFAPESEFTTILNRTTENLELNSIILKKDCYQIEINSTLEDVSTVVKQLKYLGINILNTVFKNGKLFVLSDSSESADLLQDFEYSLEKTDLIVLCGNNLNKTTLADMVKLFNFQEIDTTPIQIVSHNDNSIIIAIDKRISIIFAHHLHEIILGDIFE